VETHPGGVEAPLGGLEARLEPWNSP
jgi:hypothetical protein